MIRSPGVSEARPFTKARAHRCLEALRANFHRASVITRRDNRIVIRWPDADPGKSIIIKMWSRPDLRGKLRRWLRIAPSDLEWRNLLRLEKIGVATPRALGSGRVVPSIDGYTDVLFMEDLGDCETALDYLKQLVRAGEESLVLSFENAVIDMTRQLVDAGMLDDDHGLLNIVVQRSGRPVRLDLEITRRVFWPRLFPSMYGRMLGRLIGLHAFAVQPDVGRTTRFAERLRGRLEPPQAVLERAAGHARAMMAKQREKIGIDTQLALPWD